MSWVNSRNTGHTCSGFSKSATVVIPCPTLFNMPARVKCAVLGWHTMEKLLDHKDEQ